MTNFEPSDEFVPRRVNFGGNLAPGDVVGRDEEIAKIRGQLERTSVLLTGERRLGKTSVARVIHAEHPRSILLDAEGQTEVGLIDTMIRRLQEGWGGGAASKIRLSWELQAGPLRLAPEDRPRLLDDIVTTALEVGGGSMLIMVDELPWFARDAELREPGSGIRLLATLRRLRQTNLGLRMLLLGSRGFHHAGPAAEDAVNDVFKHRLKPLSEANATELAGSLLTGEEIACTGARKVATTVARAAEGYPYYIQGIVERMRLGPAPEPGFAPADIDRVIAEAIRDPDDPWSMRKYIDRVGVMYGEAAPLAYAVLDALAAAEEKIGLDDLERTLSLSPQLAPVSRTSLVSVARRLESDYYLLADGPGDRFTTGLLRRAWRLHRLGIE